MGRVRELDAMRTGVISIREALPVGVAAPAMARKALESMAGKLSPDLLSHGQLLVSELVSERIRQSAREPKTSLRLDISLTSERLRVQLSDPNSYALTPLSAGEFSHRLDLQILAGLADRWGMRQNNTTLVWFELDR